MPSDRGLSGIFSAFAGKVREKHAGLAVVIIAFLVYANSLSNGFVGDDHSVILHNPALHGSPLSLFNRIDTTSDTQLLPFYRPLTYLTFMAETYVHGASPFPMHFFNVVLHVANSFLVYRLARTLFNEPQPSLIAGLLFAVHPLHTEGVNFLSGGRNTMLACLFVLSSYLVHRRSTSSGTLSAAYLGSMLYLAGLFSKEVAMAVLPFIGILELSSLRNSSRRAKRQAILRLVPYAVATAGYLLIRWETLSRLGIQLSILPGFGTKTLESMYSIPSLGERLLNNVYILPRYLLTVICPVFLSPRYNLPDDLQVFSLQLFTGWILIIGIVTWYLLKGRRSWVIFGMSWLTVFWLPVSGIIFFSGVQMADRFLYIPAIGIWLVVAGQVQHVMTEGGTSRKYVVAILTVILAGLAVLTMQRNLDWKSDLTLFKRLVQQFPENPHGHLNLASAYIERRGPGDLSLAERELERALILDPSLQAAYTPLGYVKLESGDFEAALYYYSEALSFMPFDRDARINRAITYEKLGKYHEAYQDYQFFLSIPGYNNIPGSREYAEGRLRGLAGR